MDGILGMAFPALSQLHKDPFFVTANSQGSIEDGEFGFYLASSPSGSELFLGGTNSALYTGSIEYHSIVEDPTGFWQIGNASIASGSITAVFGFDTIIDSGTTLMYVFVV
jgi:cathepsin D